MQVGQVGQRSRPLFSSLRGACAPCGIDGDAQRGVEETPIVPGNLPKVTPPVLFFPLLRRFRGVGNGFSRE